MVLLCAVCCVQVVTLWEVSLVFFLFILLKAEFISSNSLAVLAALLATAMLVNLGLACARVLGHFLESTSAANLEELSRRDRSISSASSRSERERSLSLVVPVFAPFNTSRPGAGAGAGDEVTGKERETELGAMSM